MSGILLNQTTGKPLRVRNQVLSPRGEPFALEGNYRRGWRGGELSDTRPDFDALPDHIQEMLAKSSGDNVFRKAGFSEPRFDHSNYEVLRYWITADTTLNTIAELIMVPAFNFGPSEMQVGTTLKMTLLGSYSLAATPGTTTMRMRWGGAAGALQATATPPPLGTGTVTTASSILEYWMTVRTTGAAGTLWCQGRWQAPVILDAAATVATTVLYLKAEQIPQSAAAVGAATDFTATLGPTPTLQQTVNTYVWTTHLAMLECMN